MSQSKYISADEFITTTLLELLDSRRPIVTDLDFDESSSKVVSHKCPLGK